MKKRLTLKDIEKSILREIDYYDSWKPDYVQEELHERLSVIRAAQEEIRILKLERRTLKKRLTEWVRTATTE